MRPTDLIENERVEKLKAINEKNEQVNILSKKIYELETALRELKESKRMGKHTLSVLRTEAEILMSEFFSSKNR